MSGTVYSITPSSGANFYQTYPLQPPIGGTGPQYPLPGMQLGMQPGKVLRGSNAFSWILGQTAAAAVAANATGNLNTTTFVWQGATAGIPVTAVVAVPAQSLAWFQMGAVGAPPVEDPPPPPVEENEVHQPSRGRPRS